MKTILQLMLLPVMLLSPILGRAATFDQNSAVLTNPYMAWNLGAEFVFIGTDDAAGISIHYRCLAVENIGGVNCLKVETVDFGRANLRTYWWLAQDTDGNIWQLQQSDEQFDGSWETESGEGLYMPASFTLGESLELSGLYSDVYTVVSLTGTAPTPYRTFTSCVILELNEFGLFGQDFIAPGFGPVRVTFSGFENGSFELQSVSGFNPPAQRAPVFAVHPNDQTIVEGEAAVFTVSASGDPTPTYQWQRQPADNAIWSDLATGGGYSGTASPTLTVNGTTLVMSGDRFRCVATNVAGSATGNPATLTVMPLPPETYTLQGVIRQETADGAPLAEVEVQLTGPSVSMFSTLTDASGHYAFHNLEPSKEYTVTPAKTGFVFEPASQTVMLSEDTELALFIAISPQVEPDPLGAWHLRDNPLSTRYGLHAVTWGSNRFVAVGGFGTILTSPDGIGWTIRSSGTESWLYGVTWSGSQFVAVGESSTILTSPDGITWTGRSSGTSQPQRLYDVVWSDDQFVAVGWNGTILSSPDGIRWSSRGSGTAGGIGIEWSGSQFVVVGWEILTSPDGIDWTRRSSGTTSKLWSVTWSGSQFVAVGELGTILTSPDGIEWTSRSSGTSVWLRDLTWNGEQFVAVRDGGTILSSPDGIGWTSRSSGTGSSLYGVTWSGSQVVAVGEAGTILSSGSLISTPILHISRSLPIGAAAPQITIEYPVVEGKDYVLEFHDDLRTKSSWNPVPDGPHNTGVVMVPGGAAQRFFRVRIGDSNPSLSRVTLKDKDSYHFSTGERGFVTGGEFYVHFEEGVPSFWANNEGQRGVISLGPGLVSNFDTITPPVEDYMNFGVPGVVGHMYVALARAGEEGRFIIFRVERIGADEVELLFGYR